MVRAFEGSSEELEALRRIHQENNTMRQRLKWYNFFTPAEWLLIFVWLAFGAFMLGHLMAWIVR